MSFHGLYNRITVQIRNRNYCCCSLVFAKLFLFLLITSLTFSSNAIEKVTIENLTDVNRVLSSAIELHLTSESSPLINSTISLNHEDAWLFFDNIRPSDVIADHISGVLINGETLKVGVNGRVAMYAHGTVIMPFGFGYKPLTIYTEDDFGGNSNQLTIETYHNHLGEFDNAIKSFKLKRGYMATFANNDDGTGYSRVFIADKEDLVFNVMPAELYGTVSFIRIFEYEWVTKKGKAGWNPNDINATNYYDWNIGGNSSTDVEYVAIRQNGGWPSWNDINSKQNITHLLGFNEPDRPDQANMNFSDMIEQWPDMMKSGLRLGSPAWSNPWSGNGGNLFDFINKCDELNYRVDFVALHCYWGGKSPQNWYNDLKYIHEQTGRPLWITEWNNGANWTTEWWPDASRAYTTANAQKQLNDIKGILQVLDTASFVERYFIYDWVEDCRAMILNSGLTKAGEYYTANKSQIAWNSDKQVIPQWSYTKPKLDYRYFSLKHSIRLSWEDNNGELSREYSIAKKVNDGEFETIYSGTDISKPFYLDPLDSMVQGKISYQLKILTANGEQLFSNEVSNYQTAGSKDFQFGSFSLSNTAINTSFFSAKYSAVPLVLLGIPTFNNTVPFTQRVTATTSTSFNFNFEPWLYLSNSKLTKSEDIAALGIPAGSYDFEGLKAETKSVTGITREWKTVKFDQGFDTEPVVFCTIATDGNLYPLTVGVRNVTKTGFELSLKSEEKITAALFPETINYFAIERGKGVIEGKRISVGTNYGESGISSDLVEISYDSTYTEPALFAGLQSANDTFASTLRYSKTGDSGFEIIKHREMSGGEATMQTDDFGWMVIDFAADQPDVETGIDELSLRRSLEFYPNPAKQVVHFNFDELTQVEVFDLTGQKHLESMVSKTLNISSLSAGTYILKAEGRLPGKLIKLK